MTLKPLLIPKWKWDEIAINFILGLPKMPTREDSIWVVVDCLKKSAHFIPIKVKDLMDKLTRLFKGERRHPSKVGIPSKI
jgi:hypothetical protein